YTFEWTLKPTEEWAEGKMPIDFHYEILLFVEHEPIVSSEFTAAVPYITNEYYEGGSSSSSPSTTDPAEGADNIPSTPAFTFPLAIIGMMLAAVCRR
ncbi:MAG: sarcinarray family MAST domain-containing protein, partial [Methanosarcinaceae archaeon]